MSLLRFLLVLILVSRGLSGFSFDVEFVKDQSAFKVPDYPYRDSPLISSDFQLDVSETSITLSLSEQKKSIPVTLRYNGEHVVLQYYAQPVDQMVFVLDDIDSASSGSLTLLKAKTDPLKYQPFSNGIHPNWGHYGIVFCGRETTVASFRQYYNSQTTHILDMPPMSEKEKETFRKVMLDLWQKQENALTVVADTLNASIKLEEFYEFTKGGTYRGRAVYYLYPQTQWCSRMAPLNNGVEIHSAPITIHVKPN